MCKHFGEVSLLIFLFIIYLLLGREVNIITQLTLEHLDNIAPLAPSLTILSRSISNNIRKRFLISKKGMI